MKIQLIQSIFIPSNAQVIEEKMLHENDSNNIIKGEINIKICIYYEV